MKVKWWKTLRTKRLAWMSAMQGSPRGWTRISEGKPMKSRIFWGIWGRGLKLKPSKGNFGFSWGKKINREEGIVLLTEQIEREVKKVSQNLGVENKIRDEACKKLTSMFDETYNKMRESIVVIFGFWEKLVGKERAWWE
jgi:hypothetical protein